MLGLLLRLMRSIGALDGAMKSRYEARKLNTSGTCAFICD